VSYAILGQWATDAPFGSSSAGGGILDVLGRWRLWDRNGPNPGEFAFALRYRHQAGGVVPLDLDQSIGSITNTAGSFGSGDKLEVKQGYLEQVLFSKRVLVRLGRFFPDDYFDAYSLKSTRRFFLNSAFSDNPAVAFPDSGIGAMFQVEPVRDLAILFGATDTSGLKLEDTGLRPKDNVFGAMEAVWSPDYGPFGKPVNRLMYWHTNSSDQSKNPDGNGVTYTFEQAFPSGITAFLRFAYSATVATSVQTLFTAGAGVDHPFGQRSAYAGAAVALARPSGGSTHNEKVFETFYRIRLISYFEVTGDVQVIFDPAKNPSASAIGVFGARGRVFF
jgi:carbohydrate-selective porin OprB